MVSNRVFRFCRCGLTTTHHKGVWVCHHCDEECQVNRNGISCRRCAIYSHEVNERTAAQYLEERKPHDR